MKRPYLQPELDVKKFLSFENIAVEQMSGKLDFGEEGKVDDEDGDTIE